MSEHDVFLSYARSASHAPVDALHAALTAAGVSAFLLGES